MPDYELHADYDRNGRVAANTSEYSVRQAQPGAIILANLDADDRRLPDRVNPGPDITIDWQRPTKSGRDNDFSRIIIHINNPSLVQQSNCFLRLSGQRVDQVCIYDNRGHELTRRGSPPAAAFYKDYLLTFSSNRLELKIEAQTLVGSPLPSRRYGHITICDPLRSNEALVKLELICIDSNGQLSTQDWGYFTIAPLLFVDNMAPAERIYICELPENGSAVQDIESIIRGIGGVQLITVPPNVSQDDAWLQDQFQMGYCHGPNGWMHVVLHLPRLRSNVVQSELTENLSTMITSHFPSRGLGVFQEFWRRELTVQDVSHTTHRLPFSDSHEVLMKMARVYRIRKFLLREIHSRERRTTNQQSGLGLDFFEARRELPNLLQRLLLLLDRQIAEAESDARAILLRQVKRAYRTRVQEVVSPLPVTGNSIHVPLSSNRSVELSSQEVNRLFNRLRQMQDSVNYGGNIEVSPPISGFPLGKIVVGNIQLDSSSELMDPDLLHFLRKQMEQPLAEIDTSWLDVGHVDELITFVEDRTNRSASILRASPGIALQILQEARAQYLNGLPVDHPNTGGYRPSGILSRHMDEGQKPVTHLLRGKQWLHHHPRNALMELEPPWIHRKMAEVNSGWMVSVHKIPYHAGEGDDRRYFSNISISEFLYFETDRNDQSVNQFIESEFMRELDSELQRHFANVPVIKLPVLFDAIGNLDSWRDGRRVETTAAFTPNLVNMQVINGYLIIPRPYGPRMKVQDAINVLQRVFRESSQSSRFRGVNARYFRRRNLDKTYFWVKSADRVYITGRIGTIVDSFGEMTNASHVAKQFKDGFPGLSMDEIEERIYRANRAHFTRSRALRSGWHRLIIPENTVDLFEAYTQIVVESLGLRVRWVDSWFYHVRFGEIHCGTNVIRRPDTRSRNAWWRVNPPTQYQFGEEVVQGHSAVE
jgi:hypothetical protein